MMDGVPQGAGETRPHACHLLWVMNLLPSLPLGRSAPSGQAQCQANGWAAHQATLTATATCTHRAARVGVG